VDIPVLLVLAALIACAGIGALSGFLGIGGGILFIPLFTAVGRACGLTATVAIKQAMGTSLLVASLTALSGWFVHRRAERKDDRFAVPLAAGVAGGALAGATVSARFLGTSLYPLFGGALLIGAVLMLARRERGREGPLPRGVGALLLGLPIGFASSLVGLGGAVFTGFLFSGLLGHPIRRVAAATSLAQVFGGTLGWIGSIGGGWGAAGTAPLSLGYVSFPAAALAIACSWPAARLGARLTHRTAPLWARIAYAVLLTILAVRFLA
jgi:hypothetical protein